MFPNFPALKDFLAFWETKLEGPLFAVTVAHSKLIKPAELRGRLAIAHCRAAQKIAQPSLVQHLELPEPSARFHRKDKDLAGINPIWISNMVPVRFVNQCVSHARAVGDTADAPEAVAGGYDRGRDLRRDYGGG
jgi:Usg-like family